ncbi:DUF4199 domain-containing protein [Chitinophaga nivalis]|uniref:DUF4199 domain-containing protein n=1 Tax=Chitinophaga nivalis TaxID=2991709 RepID=A0ABT3IVX8_9BACT|nr:DUF4199 domain-containing protein [Chitinophaga nivalis]MCW3462175.1 hypothetical protein [Chitinophaga nivalis]MCW3488133.1 hypothetical protein [Chitinophaga nivalis]
MQTSSSSVTIRLPLIYGLTIAVTAIIFSLIFYATRSYGDLWTGYFGGLVMFLGVLIAIIHYNKSHHDKTSLMSSFGMGFRTTVLAAVLIAVFTLLFHLAVMSGPDETVVMGGAHSNIAHTDAVKDNFRISLLGNLFFVNIVLGLLASMIGAMVFKSNQKTTTAKKE